MSWFRRVARIGLVALLLNAGLILVPGNRLGAAFAIDIATADPSRSEAPPTAGDPDGPTGDIAPPTSGSIDDPGTVIKRPVTRITLWSRISTVMQLWFRFTFVR